MARAASAVEEGLAAAHMETNAFGALKVAVVEEGRHGGAGNVRHARAGDSSKFTDVGFGADGKLRFTVVPGARGLQAMLPVQGSSVSQLTRNGQPVSYTTETIKGKVVRGIRVAKHKAGSTVRVRWSGKDGRGRYVAAGTYGYTLTAVGTGYLRTARGSAAALTAR